LLAAAALLPAGAAMADMVKIPGGTYTLGSDQGRDDERPAHPVVLRAFSIDRHEVTNAQFLAFLEALMADRSRDIRLVGDAAPGTASARVIQGEAAARGREGRLRGGFSRGVAAGHRHIGFRCAR